jgi:YceI-like domain
VARYRIVPERSRVWIDALSSLHPIHSTSDGLEGYVELELGVDGGVDVTEQPAGSLSLAVSLLSSGNRLEDREMQKRIDARRYPTIQGTLREIQPVDGDGCYRVTGDVSFRGVSRPHQDQMTIHPVDDGGLAVGDGGAETLRLSGASRFDVRDFGMEPPRILMLRVEPEVDVRVDVIAVKEV